MRKPPMDPHVFKGRRKSVLKNMKAGSVFVLWGQKPVLRNSDVHHPFRQDSDFYYLTGLEESDSILVLEKKASGETREIIFVQKKDPLLETWEGFLFGPDLAKEAFIFEEAYENSKFDEHFRSIYIQCTSLYLQMSNPSCRLDNGFLESLNKYKRNRRLYGGALPDLIDLNTLLNPLRMIKSEHEIILFKEICQISAEAHNVLLEKVRPGMNERELHGLFIYEIMKRGAEREAYGGIFAAGANATTLHYIFNDQVCEDGDLVLVDAGGERKGLCADITRTFPVNGTFTNLQKQVYEEVLKIQNNMINLSVEGSSMEDIHKQSVEQLTGLMVELKLLSGSVKENIEQMTYKKYYPHGLSHYLGMDVHDVGPAKKPDEPLLQLKTGMVITIEPGIYIPKDDDRAPKELRGLGIRIEDDILIQGQTPVNLTIAAIKEY